MAATILIVDDHVRLRALMREIVAEASDLHVVGEAEDGAEALRRIKAERPATTVIIVTVHAEDAYRQAAADGGADAFLLKKTLVTVLLPTLQRLRGALPPPPVS